MSFLLRVDQFVEMSFRDVQNVPHVVTPRIPRPDGVLLVSKGGPPIPSPLKKRDDPLISADVRAGDYDLRDTREVGRCRTGASRRMKNTPVP